MSWSRKCQKLTGDKKNSTFKFKLKWLTNPLWRSCREKLILVIFQWMLPFQAFIQFSLVTLFKIKFKSNKWSLIYSSFDSLRSSFTIHSKVRQFYNFQNTQRDRRLYCLPKPSGRVTLTVPSPSSRTTQLLPGCWGLEVVAGGVIVITLGWMRVLISFHCKWEVASFLWRIIC
jgi:hypothetical protein